MNIDEAKKNIEVAKRWLNGSSGELDTAKAIEFGITRTMVEIAEQAIREGTNLRAQLTESERMSADRNDARVSDERLAARCANKIDLPSDDFDYDAARAQYASKSKEELLDTIENLTRAARSLATQHDQLAAIGEPSYQEITSAWFGTESERVCFDGALRVLNLFRKHASTTQSPEPTTPTEAVAVRDGVDLDTEHALLSTLLNADNAVAIGKDPEASNLWERFQSLLKANNMTTGARPLYMADLRLFSKLLDR